jgi:hypothetical protein
MHQVQQASRPAAYSLGRLTSFLASLTGSERSLHPDRSTSSTKQFRITYQGIKVNPFASVVDQTFTRDESKSSKVYRLWCSNGEPKQSGELVAALKVPTVHNHQIATQYACSSVAPS